MQEPAIPDDGRPLVLVTGASSGIGRATAIELGRTTDVHLVLAARREDALQETARLVPPRTGSPGTDRVISCIPCDLGTQAGIDTLVTYVRDDVGRLDALVNNAGVGGNGPFDAPTTMDDADRMLALNLRAPIALTHALLELLRSSRGAVVNVSSVAGLVGTPDAEVYSSTKWALTGFSEALRASQAHRGVRVVCIHPGPVPTPGWPHERLSRSRPGRWLLASDVEAIARTCVRAVQGRGSVSPVRPRTYAGLPFVRGVAPWVLRGMLAWAGRRDLRASLHAPETDEAPTT